MLIPDLQVNIDTEQLIVRFPAGLRTCSSAIWGGGFSNVDTIVNIRVDKHYSCSDPINDSLKRIRALDMDPSKTVGLLTAARVAEAGIISEEGPEFKLTAIVTAGVGNAAKAGYVEKRYPGYLAGTINIIVVIEGKMTDAAMVNAVMTATEAKTAALQDAQIVDEHGNIATGTTTDAVVIAVTNSSAYTTHTYCGSATEIGDALAKAVYHATTLAIKRERQRKLGKV